MGYQDNILLEIINETGIIKIDNPPQNFLYSPEFISTDVLKEWITANQLKGLVITGCGRHFSAGASLDNLFSEAFDRVMEEEMNKGKALLEYIRNLEIPVFAAIKGVCFGGGLELALSADVRICSPNALFAFPEVNHNLLPGLGGTVLLSETAPVHDVITAILGGDMISADEAKILKLVDVINEDPFGYSIESITKLTSGRSLKVIGFIMRAINNAGKLPREEALLEETKMFCELAKEEAKRRRT